MNKYAIFDVNQPLMGSYPIVEGKSNADAVKTYCSNKYPNYKPKCSGSDRVQLSAQQCVIEDGRMMLLGYKRKSWFELIPKNL